MIKPGLMVVLLFPLALIAVHFFWQFSAQCDALSQLNALEEKARFFVASHGPQRAFEKTYANVNHYYIDHELENLSLLGREKDMLHMIAHDPLFKTQEPRVLCTHLLLAHLYRSAHSYYPQGILGPGAPAFFLMPSPYQGAKNHTFFDI